MKIIVIGGGAAGFFTAINIAEKHPNIDVTILEKSSKLLQKVKVSGGGRCNVTNARSKPSDLVPFYPRGGKKLHAVFKQFSTKDMVAWLSKRGVETKTEDDLRMFPVTDSSQTIIDCFLGEAKRLGVEIIQNQPLVRLWKETDKWKIETLGAVYQADRVIVATGSSPATWEILNTLGLALSPRVPSLFTFNITDNRIAGLQGISFENTKLKVAGTKLEETGPLLITHWGLSGPAVLKLSARGAYELAEKNYKFHLLVNFTGIPPNDMRTHVLEYVRANPKRKVANYPLFGLPKRFWEKIISYCGIENHHIYEQLTKKHLNKLVEELAQGDYGVSGKSTFKEEFVTAGGVKLSEINLETFECKRFPGLYLAGEVLDIDALTGGFNFQACWSAGWIIGHHLRT